MLRAVLRKGAIVPLEPVPLEWEEGAVLEIAKVSSLQVDINVWAKLMNELCSDSNADDEAVMHSQIDEHRKLAKEQMRHEMGLSA
jgi:hypothetical protein